MLKITAKSFKSRRQSVVNSDDHVEAYDDIQHKRCRSLWRAVVLSALEDYFATVPEQEELDAQIAKLTEKCCKDNNVKEKKDLPANILFKLKSKSFAIRKQFSEVSMYQDYARNWLFGRLEVNRISRDKICAMAEIDPEEMKKHVLNISHDEKLLKKVKKRLYVKKSISIQLTYQDFLRKHDEA